MMMPLMVDNFMGAVNDVTSLGEVPPTDTKILRHEVDIIPG